MTVEALKLSLMDLKELHFKVLDLKISQGYIDSLVIFTNIAVLRDIVFFKPI